MIAAMQPLDQTPSLEALTNSWGHLPPSCVHNLDYMDPIRWGMSQTGMAMFVGVWLNRQF
jgi:hypothetical protein